MKFSPNYDDYNISLYKDRIYIMYNKINIPFGYIRSVELNMDWYDYFLKNEMCDKKTLDWHKKDIMYFGWSEIYNLNHKNLKKFFNDVLKIKTSEKL